MTRKWDGKGLVFPVESLFGGKIGGDISADGWHTFFGSSAISEMAVTVPSITWELF